MGTATIIENLTMTLTAALTPLAVGIVTLVVSRDGLRYRLRQATGPGIPLLAELTAGIADYLTLERDRCRVAHDAQPVTLALTLVGTAHLLFAGELGAPPDHTAVADIVASIMVAAQPS